MPPHPGLAVSHAKGLLHGLNIPVFSVGRRRPRLLPVGRPLFRVVPEFENRIHGHSPCLLQQFEGASVQGLPGNPDRIRILPVPAGPVCLQQKGIAFHIRHSRKRILERMVPDELRVVCGERSPARQLLDIGIQIGSRARATPFLVLPDLAPGSPVRGPPLKSRGALLVPIRIQIEVSHQPLHEPVAPRPHGLRQDTEAVVIEFVRRGTGQRNQKGNDHRYAHQNEKRVNDQNRSAASRGLPTNLRNYRHELLRVSEQKATKRAKAAPSAKSAVKATTTRFRVCRGHHAFVVNPSPPF